jgi:hypothetical protein
VSDTSTAFGTVARIGSKSHLVTNPLVSFVVVVVAVQLVLSLGSWESLGAESSPPPPATNHIEGTNSQEALQVYLQLQEQLHATQLAIEQNRQETKEAAAQTAAALAKGLQSIQQALSAQRAQDLQAMQKSNQVMLVVAGTVAAMGFLTMLILTFFQWRMSKGLAEISAALPSALGLGAGSAADAPALTDQADLPLLGAVEQVEKRTYELEQSSQPALKRRMGTSKSIENRIFPAPGDSFRRRQFRALKVAVMVGLVCAAVLALLFYAATTGKLGFGHPQGN